VNTITTDTRPPTPIRSAALALAAALATLAALFLSVPPAGAAGPRIEEPGKLHLQRLFGPRVLSGPSVLDLQVTADGSPLAATTNLGNRGAAGASVAKLTPGLEPDRSFGRRGVVGPGGLGASDSQRSSASALIPLSDGRILVAGRTGRAHGHPQLFVSRLLADGSLDPAFGDGGVRLLDPTPFRERTRRDALALQPDGSIVLAFDVRGTDGPQIGASRLTAGGALDPSFGEGGARLIPSPVLRPSLLGPDPAYGHDAVYGYDLAAASSGDLAVVASQRFSEAGRRLYAHRPVVVRLTADGELPAHPARTLDRVPDRRGEWTVHATAIEFDASDRIVVAGGAGYAPPKGRNRGYFSFHRLTAEGRIDRGFGRGGVSLVRVRPGDLETGAVDLAVQPNGRLLAAGQYAGENPAGYLGSTALVRVRESGRRDRSFDSNGVFRLRSHQDYGRAVALAPGDRIVVAGEDRLTRLR
jgi:uncharacterized delta-60 repeat protein